MGTARAICHRQERGGATEVAVESIDGVPFRMYVERPRRVEHLLAFASRWGARPHVVQGERVLTFDDLRHDHGCEDEGHLPAWVSGPANGSALWAGTAPTTW